MSEFEEWWEFIGNPQTPEGAEKYVAKRAWNAALDEVRSRYNLYIEDMNTKVEEIDQKISELYNDY